MIRTGRREVREYLLRSISTRYRIHLFLGVEPDWELAYVDGWTFLDNTRDPDVVIAEARRLHRRDPIAGVLCWDESRIAQTARVVAALGLPGPSPDVIERCRDKRLTRLALDRAGVPQPRSIRADTVHDALTAAEEWGYPVILKPSDLAFSMGVVRADDAAALATGFEFTSGVDGGLPGYRATVLVEEYVTGVEISVDAAVRDGQVQPVALARKQLGFDPYCVEIGHYVDAGDPLLTDPRVLVVLRDAHAALGFTDGFTHTELKLSPTGPKVIEVNGRIGGGLVPYLGLRATGIDPGLAVAAVACDEPLELVPDRKLVAGVRFFYVDADDTVIDSIGFDGPLPDAIDEALVVVEPGARKSPPPRDMTARVALAIAVADTVDGCLGALDGAAASLRITPREGKPGKLRAHTETRDTII